jgi:hypothetical protein
LSLLSVLLVLSVLVLLDDAVEDVLEDVLLASVLPVTPISFSALAMASMKPPPSRSPRGGGGGALTLSLPEVDEVELRRLTKLNWLAALLEVRALIDMGFSLRWWRWDQGWAG